MDLEAVRARTLALVGDLEPADLHRPLAPIMSPLVWDLGHIAAYEDLWAVHRLGREPLLRPDLAQLYDAFETPRPARAEMALPGYDESLDYLARVRERTVRVMERTGPHELHELVLRHELQHTETMRQALFLGSLPGGNAAQLPACADSPEAVVAGGEFEMGAPDAGF